MPHPSWCPSETQPRALCRAFLPVWLRDRWVNQRLCCRFALALVSPLALVACEPLPTPPLKVGLSAWVGNDPLVLAQEKQLMARREVKLIELSSGSETLRNFRNGLLDAAALTLDETLRLADEGVDVKIVAVLGTSVGADLVMARESVAGLEQLKGKLIAVERTTAGAVMLRRLLQAAGLKEGELMVRHLEASQHLEALLSRRVDAAVTYEPLAQTMREAGFHELFNSREAPGDIVSVLVVRPAGLAEHGRQVGELLAGWQRGVQAVTRDPAAAAALLSRGTGLSPAEYQGTLSGLRLYSSEESLELLSGQPIRLGQDAERLVLTMVDMGLIKDTPDWGKLVADVPALRALQTQGERP